MADPYAAFSSPASQADPYAAFSSPAGAPQHETARVVGQAATGLNDALYGAALAPLDFSGWIARNTGLVSPDAKPPSRAVTDTLASVPGKIGIASPDAPSRFEPSGNVEKYARGAGEGVGNVLSTLVPSAAVANVTKVGTLIHGVAKALAANPVLQLLAGETAGGITGVTDNPWLGMGAAIALPAGVAGATKVARGANALVQPFRAAGRDEIVGKTLNTLADDPKRAAANMESYTPPVPGFKLTAAKAANDDSLLATENALNKPGSGFGPQANGNNAVLSDALAKLDAGGDARDFVAALAKQDAGAAMRAQAALDALPPSADAATTGLALQGALRGRYDALFAARKEAADPLYRAARSSTENVNPWEMMTKTADSVAAEKGEPQAVMQKVRSLLFTPDGTPDRTARGMMATRNAINDMLDNQQLGNYSRSLLIDMKGAVDRALSVVPEEQAARETFAKHSVPLEPFDAKLGNRNVAATIAKDRFGKNFLAAPETVPGRFFRPGEAGAATTRELLDANPGLDAKTALYSYIGGRARDSGNIGGFSDRYGPAINALSPRLGPSLNEAATTNALASGYRSSPAGRFVTGDTDAAMRSTLGAPDSGNRVLSLRGAVSDDPKAVAGMQKALLDDFRTSALSKAAEDTAGNPRLVTSGAERWLQANRDSASKVLTAEQMGGIESIARALKEQSRSANRVTGSDTGRNLATQNLVESLLWKGTGESALFSPLRRALGLVYSGANEKIADRLTEAMLDPKVAAALMRKATPETIKSAVSALDRLAASTAAGSNVDTSDNRLRGGR